MRDTLQQAISCVSTGVFVGGSRGATNELLLTSQLPRSTGCEHITLVIEHRYALLHDHSDDARAAWKAQTVEYFYSMRGADGRELIAYHWHPTGRSPMRLPHMHLGASAGTLRSELQKAHLETGMITPVALLTLLIERFGVRPRRADWETVLERVRRALTAAG